MSDNIEQTLKSFYSKRIKGGIRRAIDINRGNIRLPEHKINEIRNNPKDKKMVALFFNSMFLSIDERFNADDEEEDMIRQIADESQPYNMGLLNVYLKGLLKTHLNETEYQVLRLSYGLDCEKHSANQIAAILGIEKSSAYVRISEIKKQAVQTLIDSVDHTQVIDYL
jgi:DNA-directed RNA polymerase specialized sigma subunit